MPAPVKKCRVLIVEDSAFMRKVLRDIIATDPEFEVVGEAADGRAGVAMAASLQPDVMTMDINMPHLDGLQATEQIMTHHPRPIVIVSSESREGADITLRALEFGAIDFVPKPSNSVDLDMGTVGGDLLRKLKMAAKVRVVRSVVRSKLQAHSPQSLAASGFTAQSRITSPTATSVIATPPRSVDHSPLSSHSASSASAGAASAVSSLGKFPIVVIAASTGGPATVTRLVRQLPRELPAAVILVLHMPSAFTSQFSAQLSEISRMHVKQAQANESIEPGTIYVCPGSHHLRITSSGHIALDHGERISGYLPCADVTLESVADIAGPTAIAVILTGMGNDGTKGALAVKASGGHVIAQDESTSVIFGMPAEAAKAGAVHEVLPIEEIAASIERQAHRLSRLEPETVR